MENKYRLTGFSLDNFRVFSEKTKFNLAPITILTGTNSSGKSSLTKAIQLLTTSYKATGLRTLDLMNKDLKLGGFDSIVNHKSRRKQLSFELEFELEDDLIVDNLNAKTKYVVSIAFAKWGCKFIKINNENGELLFEKEFIIKKSNGIWDISSYSKSFIKITEEIINQEKLNNTFNFLSPPDLKEIYNCILKYLQNNIDAHSGDIEKYIDLDRNDILQASYISVIHSLANIGKTENIEFDFEDAKSKSEHKLVNNRFISTNPKFKDILPNSLVEIIDNNLLDADIAPYLQLDKLNDLKIIPVDILSSLSNNFEFISGVRATQEIIYTKENNPLIFELLNEFSLSSANGMPYQKIEYWLNQLFEITHSSNKQSNHLHFSVRPIEGYGYIVQLNESNKNNDASKNGLASFGYGITQLLPILLRVGLNFRKLFIIEEPEGNLHPALQSKLADFFVDAYDENLFFIQRRFLIETHSEYLIRKLQYLVAKGKIAKEAIQIYYFNHPGNTKEDQIVDIQINKDGSFTDSFGSGFFDEAIEWKFKLLELNQPQKN